MTSPDFSKGVMVALYPSAEAAKKVAIEHENALDPDGMHVTLAYIGNKGEDGVPDQEDWPELQDAVRDVAKRHAPVEADVTGTCRFTPGDDGTPFVGIVGSHTIHQVRQDLVNQLKGRGIPVKENFAFVPHTTLTYLGDGEDTPQGIDEPVPMELSPHLVVEYGEQQTHHPFGKEAPKPEPKEASTEDAEMWEAFRLGQFVPAPTEGPLPAVPDEDVLQHLVEQHQVDRSDVEDSGMSPLDWHEGMHSERGSIDLEQPHWHYPGKFEDQHKPDHEYVGSNGGINYHIAGCSCGWASNVRSEYAANNAWQRHITGLDEAARLEKAGEPHYVHPSPKTKRWGSADDDFDNPQHDYDPGWDYDIDEDPHPAVVAAAEATRPKLEETARHLGMGRPSIHYVKDLGNAVATYASGTAPHPVLMIDGKAHEDVDPRDLREAVHDSLFHEFAHGVQDWLGDEEMDEDEAEGFARAVSLTGDHKARASELEAGIGKRLGSWVDQVSRPYSDGAIAEEDEGMEPVMPPLYQGGFGVWPDDIPEDPTRTVHPVDIFSGPKTGRTANMYVREAPGKTFHIWREHAEEKTAVCGNPLPTEAGREWWVDKPDRDEVCDKCRSMVLEQGLEEGRRERQEVIEKQHRDYPLPEEKVAHE